MPTCGVYHVELCGGPLDGRRFVITAAVMRAGTVTIPVPNGAGELWQWDGTHTHDGFYRFRQTKERT